MAMPKVRIGIVNGGLGRTVATSDGVAGLLATGIATGSLALSTPKAYFSIEQVEADGFTAGYDTTNSSDVHRHCAAFYRMAGAGATLWLMVVAPATTLTNMVQNVAASPAHRLLQAANGAIRLLAVSRRPAGSYAPTITEGIDPDVVAAVPEAQALATTWAGLYSPVRVILEGRDFQGDVADLHNFRQGTNNRVVVVVGNDRADKTAFVGLVLGRAAVNPVQRKISRVKDGDLGLVTAYLSDGQPVSSYENGELEALDDKGVVFARRIVSPEGVGPSGFFFSGDRTCTANSDDYNSLARGRVIDKATVIAYGTFVQELDDDVDVNPETGGLLAGVLKGYQGAIQNALGRQMQAKGEISGSQCLIDPLQNVLATDKVQIKLRVLPKGYASYIDVELGFENPQNEE